MRLHHTLYITAVASLLLGCATNGPRLEPQAQVRADQGVLYVLRPQARGLGILSAVIDVDGKPTHTLENGECVAIPLLAGQHTITQRWKAGIFGNSDLENSPVTTTIGIAQGQESYLQLTVESGWTSSGMAVRNEWRWELREVSAAAAEIHVRSCRRGA